MAKNTKASAKAPAPKKEVKAPENTTDFEIEDGFDLPPISGRGPAIVYPFKHMKPGQSFFVKTGPVDRKRYNSDTEYDKAVQDACRTLAARLGTAKRRFEKDNEGTKFAVRMVKDGCRVWRVAPG